MAGFDIEDTFGRVKSEVEKAVSTHFPVEGRNRTLKLKNVIVDDKSNPDDLGAQKDARLKGRTWGVPIKAEVELVDNKTGKVVDTTTMSMGSLPRPTRRLSYIVDGKEYQVNNQLRLKSGVYTRETEAGEIDQWWNLAKGLNFNLKFEPEKRKLKATYKTKSYNMYSVMKALGVDDDTLERQWGKELLSANRVSDRVLGSDIKDLYQRLTRNTDAPSQDKMVAAIQENFAKSELRPDSTRLTLGRELKNVDGAALLTGTKRLLEVSRGEAPPDERDMLHFKDLLGLEDLLAERIAVRGRVDIQRKLKRRVDQTDKIRSIISPDTFSKTIKGFFASGTHAHTPTQMNPMNFITGHRRTTVFGDGGMSSDNQITLDAQSINPSQAGFLDPIQTPESSRIGGILQMGLATKKVGKELRALAYNTKTKKMEWINSETAFKSNVAFPDQFEWSDGKIGVGAPKPLNAEVKVLDKDGEIRRAKPSEVKYIFSSPKGMFDFAANTIPFLNENQGNRTSVAAKQLEQAVALSEREEPLVQTKMDGPGTFEKALGGFNAHMSPVDGTVLSVGKDKMVIKGSDGKKHTVHLYDNFPTNDQKGVLQSTPIAKVGDKVKKRQVVADSNFTKNGTLALGTNLRIAYTPYKGYNFEDGIVISDSAAKKLTSDQMTKHDVEVNDNVILNKKKFLAETSGQYTKEQAAKLDDDGVIQVGQIVKPGDPLIGRLKKAVHNRELTERQKLFGMKPVEPKPEVWDADYEGEVVDVIRHGKNVAVHVKSKAPAIIGDKMVGRHGNKGIITAILPDGDMPRNKDGVHAEVLLNPTGLPTRINLGQALETAASKLAEKTGKPYVVNNFDAKVKDYSRKVLGDLKKAGISDKEELIDPTTNRSMGETLFGKQYMLKLHHTAEKGISSRFTGTYDSNLQPKKGGKNSAVSMDTAGMYALLAHGARANVKEMQTIKSEQNDDYWNAVQLGEAPPAPSTPFIYQKFEGYLKGMGVDVRKHGDRIQLGPLTDDDVKAMSNGEIKNPDMALKHSTSSELKPETGGLFDPKVTGTTNIFDGLGDKWSHFTLAEKMPNPTFEKPIKVLLGLKDSKFQSIMRHEDELNGKTGPAAIVEALGKINAPKELEELKGKVGSLKGQKLSDATKRIKYLRTLVDRDVNPQKAYSLQHVPVLPPRMRPITVLESGDLRTDDITDIYRQVGAVNTQLKNFDQAGLPDEEKHELQQGLYDGLKALNLTGMEYRQRHRRGLSELIGGGSGTSPKEAFFQKKVIGKRQDLSMRGVIVPEPSLGMDEVAVPEKAALTAYKPFVIRRMRQMGYAPGDAMRAVREKDPVAMKMLEAEMSERPLMLKRDPVLHKYGVQAFRPVLTKGKAIKIHPLATSGYNADFDGDKMNAFVPVEQQAVKEAWNMMPSRNIFSSSDGKLMFKPGHESMLGLYKMSLMGKKTDKVFENEAAAAAAAQKGEIGINDVIKLKKMNNPVRDNPLTPTVKEAAGEVETTVGRLLLNQSLPEGTKDRRILEDPNYLMTKKNIDQALSRVGKKVNDGKLHAREFAQAADRFKDMGNDFASTGSGFGIEDLLSHTGYRDKVLAAARKKESELRKTVKDPKKRKQKIIDLYSKAAIVIRDEAKGKFDKEDNKMYEWVRSGARGSWDQFSQMTVSPLQVVDPRGNTLPFVIEKSYSEGLDTADYWASMYGARMGTIGRTVSTAKPGAQTKEMMQASMNQMISMDDCGTKKGLRMRPDSKDAVDRVLATDVDLGKRGGKDKGRIAAGTTLTPEILARMKANGIKDFTARTPLKCEAGEGLCAHCFGTTERGSLPRKGENIGVKAAHSLGEPLTQMAMNAFHTGGVAGAAGSKAQDQFTRVKQLVQFPSKLPGSARLSLESGTVDKVEVDKVAGGHLVYVNGKSHHVPASRGKPIVRKGATVKKGDALSEGPKNPQEMLPLSGINSVQRYVTDEMSELYRSSPLQRRNTEVFVRALTNLAEVKDPGDHPALLPGDKSTISAINAHNSKVGNGGKPVKYTPILKGTNVLPTEMQTDWMARLQFQQLKKSIMDGAAEGWITNIHGTHPVPAMAYGKEFGDGTKNEPWRY